MRITFISPPPNLSGGHRVTAIYADLLQAMGHEVTVVAPRRRVPGLRSQAQALLRGRWPQRGPQRSHFDAMRAHLHLVGHAPITAEDVPDADVVIATFWDTAFMVAGFPSSKGRKIYFVQHHEVHLRAWRHLTSGSYRLPLRKIAVAGWIADVMREVYGDSDVAVVPNAVDQSLFHAPPRDRQAVPVVGLMYSDKPFKGADTSAEAIRIARVRHPGLRVVAFGREKVARALPLPEGAALHFKPAQSLLREIYGGCDVFLAGSRSEGFGLPILEAMACRCPVIATRTGCAPDVIEDGVNGFVVDVGDAAAMGARLAELLDRDAAAWRAMSEAALARAASYSWDDAARLFEQALLRCTVPASGGSDRVADESTRL
jgi:glycosyltransferase involved in cell wall biosynthesis